VPLPSFIVAGAPKCGTTALWAFLDEHPDVFMSQVKEPRFFTRTNTFGEQVVRPGPVRPIVYDRGMAWYQSLFDTDLPIRGEASTFYFAAPDAADLIQEHIPDVKLVFLLRDPVARLYSHYWQDHKSGIDLPPFERMVHEELPEFRYYALVSSYEQHLRRFLTHFAPDRVLTLLYDDLRQNPLETFARVCSFIGAPPSFVPTSVGREYNRHAEPRVRALASLSVRLQHAAPTQALPPVVRRSLGRLREWMGRVNARPESYPRMCLELRESLVGMFETDIAYVESLLAVDLSSWRSPDPARMRT